MSKVVNFIIWPAIGGLVFGLALLQLPRFADKIPGLEAYLPDQPVQQVTINSYSYSDAIAKTAPAVVSINSTAEVGRLIGEEVINPFQSQRYYAADESSSLGSGVIISPDGYIITSYHIFELQDPDLVRNPNEPLPTITIMLYDGRSVGASIVAIEEANDLALLKIDDTELHYVSAAQESTLDVGDVVLAIGNPRNIGQSVTFGIISALLASGDSYVIQTDAAINPGNSGGALIDVDGKLVGINSTIVSESGGSEGISFAVPAARAFDLMQRYIERDPGGFLGVVGRFARISFSRLLLDADAAGLWIEEVSQNGPADKAGIKKDDIITRLADIDIVDGPSAYNAVQKTNSMNPGDTVIATVHRKAEVLEIPIVLGTGNAVLWLTEETQLLDPNPFGESLLRNLMDPKLFEGDSGLN